MRQEGKMAEIGLVPFAGVAREVAQRVLPSYRSRFSKHQCTQPQLLAMLCLMRYQDWTFRQAESRLAEPRDLREALHLCCGPDDTTLYRFLQRLDEDPVARGLGETVRRLRRGKTQVRVSCAIDGTGVSPHAVRTYFLRRSEQQNGGKKCFRHYLQWLIVVDGKQQILLAQPARQGPLGRPAGLARVRGCGGTTRTTALGAGRVRFRSQSPAYSATLAGAKYYSCTTPSGCSARNVARADVSQFSAETVRTTGEGRNRLLGGKTQAVGTRSRSSPGPASPTSPPSRTHLQPLPSQASLHSASMSTEPL